MEGPPSAAPRTDGRAVNHEDDEREDADEAREDASEAGADEGEGAEARADEGEAHDADEGEADATSDADDEGADETSTPAADDEGADEAATASTTDADETPTPAAADDGGRAHPIPLWQRLAYERPPLWYRVAQVLLPPLLAAGAVGVHWWLNVPDKILESPKDQGAKGKGNKGRAKGKDGRRAQREVPRSPEELDVDWEEYRERPFDEEPTRASWARRNQALLNRAMVVARRVAFEGAPEEPRTVLASAKCRTIRCRFVLRSPYSHELDVLGEALGRLESEGQPVWRSFEAETVTAPEGMPSHEHYLQITVALDKETTDTRSLAIGVEGGGDDEEPEPEGEEPAAEPDDEPGPDALAELRRD